MAKNERFRGHSTHVRGFLRQFAENEVEAIDNFGNTFTPLPLLNAKQSIGAGLVCRKKRKSFWRTTYMNSKE